MNDLKIVAGSQFSGRLPDTCQMLQTLKYTGHSNLSHGSGEDGLSEIPLSHPTIKGYQRREISKNPYRKSYGNLITGRTRPKNSSRIGYFGIRNENRGA